ncbi:MAG TPA: F-box-like domain-containing protein [Rhabdochlamydiaceae bacterium]|nr:F-box-like domain-containing protein [Rhabdochlamydiaceae bacterium]
MSNLAVSCPYRPFPNADTFKHGVEYWELADICHLSRVCKLWNDLIKNHQDLWKQLFEREGVSLVASLSGQPRDYREDFKTLYPITEVSGRTIGEIFGEIVGKVPPIREEWFNRLKDPDPFEEEKSIGENYVFVVDPFLIKRKEATLDLDESGNLIERPKQEIEHSKTQELEIPFSLKNIRMLCSYPLAGTENMPVFSPSSPIEVTDQCDSCPDRVHVYFMRRHIVEKSRGLSYSDQEELVTREQLEVAPVRQRTLFNATMILKSGTCPDLSKIRSVNVRHSDLLGNKFYRATSGNFFPGLGMCVGWAAREYGFPGLGVVPGLQVDISNY